jgi:hypothetical protein
MKAIKIRNLIDRTQAKLAAGTELVSNVHPDSLRHASTKWREALPDTGSDFERTALARAIIVRASERSTIAINRYLVEMVHSDHAMTLISEKTSHFRLAGDAAAHQDITDLQRTEYSDIISQLDIDEETRQGLLLLLGFVCMPDVDPRLTSNMRICYPPGNRRPFYGTAQQ